MIDEQGIEIGLEYFYVIYDSDDNNRVVGMLSGSMDPDEHDALNPDNIKISTNTVESPAGEILYLHELQVDSDGTASRI